MSAVTASRRVAVTDMGRSSIEITAELAHLSALTIFELRGEWRRFYRTSPPMRLSRDLLTRGITYRLQERSLGGLSNSIICKLQRLNTGRCTAIRESRLRRYLLKPARGLCVNGAARPTPCLSMPTASNGTAGAIGL